MIGCCQALVVSKKPIARNGTRPVTFGGWVALCSSGSTLVRGFFGHAHHPFKCEPPISGSCGPVHKLVSGFLMLVMIFYRKVYHAKPRLQTASAMSPTPIQEIQEVSTEGPFISLPHQ